MLADGFGGEALGNGLRQPGVLGREGVVGWFLVSQVDFVALGGVHWRLRGEGGFGEGGVGADGDAVAAGLAEAEVHGGACKGAGGLG